LGLGLSIVSGLARLHGGSIEVVSDGIGCGTTFTLKLPLLTASSSRDPSSS
jgi:two-component system, chemotaxis family, CheB/CheR fusion protein